jgi:glycosyltransferase involved in cell wall biosynthesis
MWLGRPIFTVLVAVELFWERLQDRPLAPPFAADLVNTSVTALIKTFERPNELQRLVSSIRRFYPEMRIIVVDDSRNPTSLEGCRTVSMEYDSGVSAGRQKGLSLVETEFFLLLDDDFVFYRKTDLEPAVHQLAGEPNIDIMGGQVVDLPLYRSTDFLRSALFATSRQAILPLGSKIAGLTVHDKVANFYLARTDSVRRVGWDMHLKHLDHNDFFSRARGILITVFNPAFRVLHAQTPFNAAYMAKRNDCAADYVRLRQKYQGKRASSGLTGEVTGD